MSNTYQAIALGITIGLTACVDPEGPGESTSALQVSEHSEAVIAGSYDAGDMVVWFRAESPREYVGTVEVTVNGKTLSVYADAYAGDVSFEANDAALQRDEIAAIATLSQALEDYLGRAEDVSVMHESVLFRAAEYFAVAPAETPLESTYKRVEGLDRSVVWGTGNNGKTCIYRGQRKTAAYDGSKGTRWETWTVGADGGRQWNGNFDCMGRCGGACGGGDWTLDCLEHDACSRHYYSSTGPLDKNCGDEYSNASDDYLNFWKRCSG